MAQGTILTTPEAERASSQMRSIIDGGLTEQIDSLVREGNTLSEPTVWDGTHAGTFRSSWPTTSRQLREARDELSRLQQAVETVRQDIVAAGGG